MHALKADSQMANGDDHNDSPSEQRVESAHWQCVGINHWPSTAIAIAIANVLVKDEQRRLSGNCN